MDGFFGVVGFDVGDIPKCFFPVLGEDFPDVGGVFPQGVARGFASVGAFVVAFSWVFGGHSYCVEVEGVVFAFGEPQDGFVAAGEAFLGVEAVAEVPDDPVSQAHSQGLKDVVVEDIQGEDLSRLHIVSDLPTDAAIWSEDPMKLSDDLLLLGEVGFDLPAGFVFLANVIGGRSHYQLNGFVRHCRKEVVDITSVQYNSCILTKYSCPLSSPTTIDIPIILTPTAFKNFITISR